MPRMLGPDDAAGLHAAAPRGRPRLRSAALRDGRGGIEVSACRVAATARLRGGFRGGMGRAGVAPGCGLSFSSRTGSLMAESSGQRLKRVLRQRGPAAAATATHAWRRPLLPLPRSVAATARMPLVLMLLPVPPPATGAPWGNSPGKATQSLLPQVGWSTTGNAVAGLPLALRLSRGRRVRTSVHASPNLVIPACRARARAAWTRDEAREVRDGLSGGMMKCSLNFSKGSPEGKGESEKPGLQKRPPQPNTLRLPFFLTSL
eukprot:91917-Chlamydomonas_euryale.AAC.2